MNFKEASQMPEGTIFDVIVKRHGGAWLNCYFKDGIVHREIGGKLAASVDVFEAEWKKVETK